MSPAVLGPTFDAQWRDRFERFARAASSDAGVSGWSDLGLTRRVDAFSRLLDGLGLRPGTALDIGCGAGTYVRLLAERGHSVIGLDYSRPSLARAVEREGCGRSQYAAGDAYSLPFPAGLFDLVVCIGVLQAVASPERVLDEATRVLHGAGVLVVEALNARAWMARADRARAALRRLPPRVRCYDPSHVRAWLVTRGLEPIRRAAIILPPRQLPGAKHLLDLAPVAKILAGATPLTEATAHSFLFAAQKAALSDGRHSRGHSEPA
jgi:SAM-dependent methyltransferase